MLEIFRLKGETMVQTAKEIKKKAERTSRVRRTVHQLLITAFVAIYPILITIGDVDALRAVLPSIAVVGIGAVVTDIYNRVRPA